MEILALLCVAGGLLAYLKILWQVRTSRRKIKPEKVIEKKLNAFIIFYLGIGCAGFHYPPLERADSFLLNCNWAEFWTSAILAVPIAICIGVLLRRYQYPNARLYVFATYVIAAMGNSGVFCLLNGALDFTPSQYHVVQVVRKRYEENSKTSRSYLLFVTNWDNSNHQLRLDTRPDIYDEVMTGTKLKLEVGSGLLGVQWVKGIRLLSETTPEQVP